MVFVSDFNLLFDYVNKLILKKAIIQMNHAKIYFNKIKNILSINFEINLTMIHLENLHNIMKRNGKCIKLLYKISTK